MSGRMAGPEELRRERRRVAIAAALAVAVHTAIAVFSLVAETTPRLFDLPRDPLEIELWDPPEPPPLPEPEEPDPEPEPVEEPPEPPPPEPPPPEPPEPEPTEVEPEPVEPTEPVEQPPEEPSEPVPAEPSGPAFPMPEPVEKAEPSGPDAPVVKLPIGKKPKKKSLLGSVMGRGSDPFGSGLKTFEKALEFKADGPMSDEKRAEKMAKKMIEDEMASDAVSAGLADDYFRELKVRLETNWRPATKSLNDGGKGTERLGMMKDMAVNTQAWGEVFKLYQEMAQQYGSAKKVKLNRDRLKMAREYFRSKKGNLRLQAISEVILTQAADGKVLTIEFPSSSGHEGIDEGIKDAIMTSVAVMPYEPPQRLSFGRAFRSRWRLRATWRMIPPTSLLTGNSWDISQKGVEMDVPFQIKLTTNIMLMSFDNRSNDVSSF